MRKKYVSKSAMATDLCIAKMIKFETAKSEISRRNDIEWSEHTVEIEGEDYIIFMYTTPSDYLELEYQSGHRK